MMLHEIDDARMMVMPGCKDVTMMVLWRLDDKVTKEEDVGTMTTRS